MTGVGRADKGDLADKILLCCRQDDPEVDIMAPDVGTLNRRCVHSEETVHV